VIEALLDWREYRVIWPVRFSHDRKGYMLVMQDGRRKSRWFEKVLRAGPYIYTAYGPYAYREMTSPRGFSSGDEG
jgi:hypothetical protein